MNGNAAISLILERCNNRSDSDLRTTVATELAVMQAELERGTTLPWFLLEDDTTTYALAAGDESTALNILRFDEETGGVWYKDTTRTEADQWVELVANTYQNMKAKYADEVTGPPEQYAIVGSTLYVRPIPDSTYDLRVLAYVADTAPADTASTNLWLTNAAQWLTCATASFIATIYLQNDALGTRLAQQAEAFRALVVRDTEARKHAGMTYQMGDD